MKEENLGDYAQSVHTSLMEKKMLFGIGDKAFYTILILTVIMASMISVYCIALGVIALLVCRQVCKEDPYLLDFLFENLNQQNIYEG